MTHFYRTVERNGRWVSECERCGKVEDIQDLNYEQIQQLAARTYDEECLVTK